MLGFFIESFPSLSLFLIVCGIYWPLSLRTSSVLTNQRPKKFNRTHPHHTPTCKKWKESQAQQISAKRSDMLITTSPLNGIYTVNYKSRENFYLLLQKETFYLYIFDKCRRLDQNPNETASHRLLGFTIFSLSGKQFWASNRKKSTLAKSHQYLYATLCFDKNILLKVKSIS